ncbi:UDP-glucose 4-epimerase GalE [Microbacterium kribbense]|uniref:UDP-glucose 4-epimerase n=1 Tax=Microbacterium kribbense TaxID=433645 RepID=A0ABP7G0D1_9MICO
MRVAVTGGAGYIGAHVVDLLVARGDEVVVLDDLSTGVRERVGTADFVGVDLAATFDPESLATHLAGADAVIHFTAKKRVDESVARPAWYFHQNITSLANVLAAAAAADATKFIFSSSAAVYGAVDGRPVPETTPAHPVNPYGETKLAGEWLVADAAASMGLQASSLRYFNVAGAARPQLGDTAALNIIPIVMQHARAHQAPVIFGDDYPTPDGTCVRDYIHVTDLARAHLAALDGLAGRPEPHRTYNVGTGTGHSVREVVDAVRRHAPDMPAAQIAPRRRGDPASVVADPTRIQRELGWSADHSLADIVDSAWQAIAAG